ncbi:MAG: nickel pincer cofactor biosynthesis protein LarC [Candidatus Latescibacterota bacterium]|nr:nickel pincer cofactor biosynthesis protein LarC [Candidatus Latescibacterota bacterium]
MTASPDLSRTAYIDCFAGASGDMLLGALVDAGLSFDDLITELSKLGLTDYELSCHTVAKHGISATKVEVAAQEGHVHRHLSDITKILEASSLDQDIKDLALTVFTRLAEAEAQVHGTTTEQVHFHEVGAVDAIVDIVGTIIGLKMLGIGRVLCSALSVGSGATRGSHGAMPIPVPAVVALCANVPLRRTGIPKELLTPTGAALLTTISDSFGEPTTFTGDRVGYGAGARDLDEIPNLLRIEIGSKRLATDLETDQIAVLETNIDDMNPEWFGHVVDLLWDAGAKDVYLTPVQMKKGRPATLVTVLCSEDVANALTLILLRETTTLGVRRSTMQRTILPRKTGTVNTEHGDVRVKKAKFEGRTRVTPEYDDCLRIAREKNIEIAEVYAAVQRSS